MDLLKTGILVDKGFGLQRGLTASQMIQTIRIIDRYVV